MTGITTGRDALRWPAAGMHRERTGKD